MYLFTLVVPRRKPFPSFLPNPAPSLSASLSLSLVSSGRKLAARSNLRLVTPSTSDNGGVCPALAARNARREKINNGDPHHGLIRQEIPPPFFHETGISAIIQVARVFSNGYARNEICSHLVPSSFSAVVARFTRFLVIRLDYYWVSSPLLLVYLSDLKQRYRYC